MESAIQTMVKVFLKSTKGKESLGQSQFQGLVKSQLSNILSDTESKEAVKNMGQGLDANKDGKVGFEEYLKLVGYLAVSLSDQRNLAKEEPAQNAASGQVAQCTPDKEEEKPEAKAESKAESKAEANPEAKEEPKPETTNDAKIEAVAEVKKEDNAGVTVEIKSDGETQPEAANVEEKAAMAADITKEATAGLEVFGKSEEIETEMEKVEKIVEKEAAAVEEEVEKKIEEATS
uniref:S100-A16 n=1 Tax=Anoplopoma fimbria TaxID=229290 RepID=C3KJ48_ANOFI|nr:S100-A16 [Anoplopoma fimbria]